MLARGGRWPCWVPGSTEQPRRWEPRMSTHEPPTTDPHEQHGQPETEGEQLPEPGSSESVTAGMHQEPHHGEDSYRGTGKLKDRVALVTGGDSGIGRAVALAFAREGADIVIAYWNEHEDARETQRVVEASGRRVVLVAGDLAEEPQCARVVEAAAREFGRIDILVDNAAFLGKQIEKFEDIDAERIRRTFAVNIEAMFHLVRHALRWMKPGAVIINTASVQAYHPSPAILDY